VVVAIRRVFFELHGQLDWSRGPVEFTFDDGSVLLLESGADGESLRITDNEWTDAFAGVLSRENAGFVERSGKWTAVDVSGEAPTASLVGARIGSVAQILTTTGGVAGLVLQIGDRQVRVEVIADDLYVEVA
jgi:hypothetical protein